MKRAIGLGWMLAMGLSMTGCGASTDGELPGGSQDIKSVQQDVYKGYTLNNAQYSSIVEVLPPGGLCSGAMMKNLAVITAKHCVQNYVNNPGAVTIQAGSQSARASQIWVHDTSDVAIIRLTNRFQTYVLSGGTFVLSYNNYVRAIYTGSDSTLDGRAVMLFGYGLGQTCNDYGVGRYAAVTADNRYDGFGLIRTYPNANGQIGNDGDSGGPLLDGLSPYASTIVAVQSACAGFACPSDPPDLCWYETAEAWGGWAYLLLLNIPS